MVSDVLNCCSHGGRIVAHHLEFDAGVIYQELGRSGSEHLKDPWAKAVREGVCTMDPNIACWVRSILGIGEIPRSIPMRLLDMVNGLLTETTELCSQHHSAGNDAIMHFLLCRELVSRCQSTPALAIK